MIALITNLTAHKYSQEPYFQSGYAQEAVSAVSTEIFAKFYETMTFASFEPCAHVETGTARHMYLPGRFCNRMQMCCYTATQHQDRLSPKLVMKSNRKSGPDYTNMNYDIGENNEEWVMKWYERLVRCASRIVNEKTTREKCE